LALHANILKDMIDVSKVTIGEALLLKHIFNLTDAEAIAIFLGGNECEDISA
jgi:hypothetical protein